MAQVIKIALILMMLFVLPVDMFSFQRRRKYVAITNGIVNMNLSVHCKSKDHDLGVQVLPTNQTFEFTFWTNSWGSTRFWCSFSWADQFKYFDIFVQRRDAVECNHCSWSINPAGPCRLNRHTFHFDIRYPWNKS